MLRQGRFQIEWSSIGRRRLGSTAERFGQALPCSENEGRGAGVGRARRSRAESRRKEAGGRSS
eukprot:14308897-Alexandrium_andersonii.AAC.1